MLRPKLFSFLVLSLFLRGADPWHAPVATWTPQDTEHLLNDSPWALRVDATMDDPAERPQSSSALPPGIAEAGLPNNAKQGATQRWDGGIAKNRMGHLATIPVTVRWDSALIVRQALERRRDQSFAALNDIAKTNFVVTVIGLLPARRTSSEVTLQQKSSSDDSAAARTGEETLEWFMANSRLLVKGLPPLEPQNVKIDRQTSAVQIAFSRSQDLLSSKRDVLFVTRFGSMSVQARFRTKYMSIAGHPDL